MAYRHERYGMNLDHFEPTKDALLEALAIYLGDKLDDELREGWVLAIDELLNSFRRAMADREDYDSLGKAKRFHYAKTFNAELINDIGGVEKIDKIHEVFYDEIFEDPWLGQFFAGKDKKMLIRKQTEFMVTMFGGENLYRGATPALAHMHMCITKEMLVAREDMLSRAILGKGVSEESHKEWLEVDRFFWGSMVKQTPDECIMRAQFQAPVIIKEPKTT